MKSRVDVTSALSYRIAEKEVVPALIAFYDVLNGEQYDLKQAAMSLIARLFPRNVREEEVFYDHTARLVTLEYKIFRMASAIISKSKLLKYDKSTKKYSAKEVVK